MFSTGRDWLGKAALAAALAPYVLVCALLIDGLYGPWRRMRANKFEVVAILALITVFAVFAIVAGMIANAKGSTRGAVAAALSLLTIYFLIAALLG